MSNQGDRQAAYRTAASSSGTYNEDAMAYAASLGHSGTYNERMIKTLQGQLTSTQSSLPGVQAEGAADRSKARWGDVGSDVTSIGT